jgi:hypothetical protein
LLKAKDTKTEIITSDGHAGKRHPAQTMVRHEGAALPFDRRCRGEQPGFWKATKARANTRFATWSMPAMRLNATDWTISLQCLRQALEGRTRGVGYPAVTWRFMSSGCDERAKALMPTKCCRARKTI